MKYENGDSTRGVPHLSSNIPPRMGGRGVERTIFGRAFGKTIYPKIDRVQHVSPFRVKIVKTNYIRRQ